MTNLDPTDTAGTVLKVSMSVCLIVIAACVLAMTAVHYRTTGQPIRDNITRACEAGSHAACMVIVHRCRT